LAAEYIMRAVMLESEEPSGLNATVESGSGFPWGSGRANLGDAHWDRRRIDRR
jgi:hypothetical protein